MGKHIPGNPNIIVRNMPGAGSLTAANHLHNIAPKDGTVLGSFSRNLPAQALIGLENVRFDARNFGWIGSPELTFVVCAAITSTGITTVEQLRDKELFVGGTGPGSAPSFMPLVVNQLAGTKFKVIEGYRSSEDVHLAMERAELGGICGATYDSFIRQEGERVKAGKTKVLFNLEEQRNPLLGDVPSIFEYISDPESRQMLTFMNLPQETGRPYAAPPGVPEDRLEALRRAFDATMKDADFLAEGERQKLTVTALTGEEIERKINDLYAIPKPSWTGRMS